MNNERIIKEMHELEHKIDYHFNDISWLAKAMGSIINKSEDQDKNHKEYSNECLAMVGDAVLKLILTDKLCMNDGISNKGEITKIKNSLENNEVMHDVMIKEELIDYSYNDSHFCNDIDIPDHEKVVSKKHDPYLEAIIGAVFYDSNFDTTREWAIKWLIPLLEKYKK